MTEPIIVGIVVPADTLTPSPHYQFWIPGIQGTESGDALDQSGNAADAALDTNTIDLADIAISSWTNASPAVFTVATHGLAVDDWVYVTGTGNSNLDNISFRVNTIPLSTTMTLKSPSGSVLNTPGSTGTGSMARGIWSDPAWISIPDSVAINTSTVIPSSKFTWNMNAGQSLLFHFRAKDMDDSGAGDGIVGTFNDNGAGTEAGFRIFTRDSDGGVRLATQGLPDSSSTGGSTYYGGDLGDGAEHTVTIIIDGVTKSADIYFDAVVVGDDVDHSAVTGTTQPPSGKDFYIGTDATDGQPISGKYRDVHCLVWNGAQPSNIQNVVNLLHSRPFYPLTADEFNP